MCNYAIANMNKGKFEGEKILETNSYSEIWREHASTDWVGYTSEIGLAWFLGEYKGNKVRSHSGVDTGFRSNLIILPEKGISVVVMINSDYIGIGALCTGILDILLGEERESNPYLISSVDDLIALSDALLDYNNMGEDGVD